MKVVAAIARMDTTKNTASRRNSVRNFGMLFVVFRSSVKPLKMKSSMKKWIPLSSLLVMLILSSCVSVRVVADYDQKMDFQQYKTYAFYKTGIDKAQISDLDKRRILKAIDDEMSQRGFVKSNNPDLLVSIFTKERERVDVYNNNFGWGWGRGWGGFYNPWVWGPGWGWGGNNVSTRTEGSLFIDFIDADKKKLVWQGRGAGSLSTSKKVEKREARIQEFVQEILEEYPPQAR